MAKEVKKLSPKEEMEIAIEAQKKIQASQVDKAPIMSKAIQSQAQTVYEHNPHIPEASMEKPKADFPEHLMGMAFRGSAIKAMNGFDPYEGYTKMAMDRYNIEQNRLNNTLQRLDSPEHVKTYTRMDTAQNQEATSNQYQAQQVELEREKNDIMKEINRLIIKYEPRIILIVDQSFVVFNEDYNEARIILSIKVPTGNIKTVSLTFKNVNNNEANI